jgi:hypothetical protein
LRDPCVTYPAMSGVQDSGVVLPGLITIRRVMRSRGQISPIIGKQAYDLGPREFVKNARTRVGMSDAPNRILLLQACTCSARDGGWDFDLLVQHTWKGQAWFYG